MTIDERLRLNIHSKLTELLGSEEADALIAHIMPVPWHDVTTKDDLRVLRSDLDVHAAELRTEIAGVRSDLGTEIAGVRADLRTEIAGVRIEVADLRTDFHRAIISQTRWLMGYVTALSAIMLTVARLLF